LKLVLDTHVWLDLLVFGHPAVQALMAELDARAARVLATPAMLDELRHVLSRPHFKLDAARQRACSAAQSTRVTPCPPAPDCRLPCTDRADQMFIDLAVAQEADALLSRDKALLRLRRGARQRFGLVIATPETYHAQHLTPPILSAPIELGVRP
jgi:putative PIN family toxin of toxin-antitoxin system